ncbi:MAG: hypothetical protein IJ253_11925 [Bacteroidaceae bacterium]|nr:hypothetical protein [Bacteroidaceae bacterium]
MEIIETDIVQQTEGLAGPVGSQAQAVQDIVGEAVNQKSEQENFSDSRFSIFGCGFRRANGKVVMRQQSQQTWDIGESYRWITSPLAASEATIGYRAMLPTATREEKSNFKLLHFQYATFAGTFAYRNAQSLIRRSPYMVLDIDDLASLDEARELRDRLARDEEVETALCFVSPSGQGVKWVFELPAWTMNLAYKEQFARMRDHLCFNYGYDADPSGSDVCRACFLPYDPECFLNPKFTFNNNNNYE